MCDKWRYRWFGQHYRGRRHRVLHDVLKRLVAVWSTATRVFCGRNAVAFGQYHSVRSDTHMVPGKLLDVYPNAVCAYNKYRLRARDFLRSAQMYTKSPTPMGGSGATVPTGLLYSSMCVWFVVLSKCCSVMSLWSDTGICSLVCWSR